jgi:hypothetical protein
MLGTASAAAALAELHGIKSERDSDVDVSQPWSPLPNESLGYKVRYTTVANSWLPLFRN